MTPGQKVLRALQDQGLWVMKYSKLGHFENTDDPTICRIIEEKSGVLKMATALEVVFDVLDGADFGDEPHSEPEYIAWKTVRDALEAYQPGITK